MFTVGILTPLIDLLVRWNDFLIAAGLLVTAFGFAYRWGRKTYLQVISSLKALERLANEIEVEEGITLKNVLMNVQRKQVELGEQMEAVRRTAFSSSAKQWAFFTHEDVPLFETNAKGECLRVNGAYLDLTDRSVDEVLGMGWVNNIHPDDRTKVNEEWLRAVEQKRIFEMRYNYISADGTRIPVYCKASALFDDRGELLGYLGTVEETSPRSAAVKRKRMQRRGGLSNAVFNSTEHGISEPPFK